jgi:hypothetical protein
MNMNSLNQASVLVVDDTPSAREVLKDMLTEIGFGTILEAADGREASALLQRQSVDIVLCDQVMPDMSGKDLLVHIRNVLQRSELPVIFVSAVGAVILGWNILALDGRLRGAEKIGEFGRGLIIQLDVSDGTGMRREEGTGRAKSMDIRGSGARLEGNEVNVIAMQQDKNIFETVVRWDGETTGEVGRRPLTAGHGAGASGVGRKGRNRGSKVSEI